MDRHIAAGIHGPLDRRIGFGIHHAKGQDRRNMPAIHRTGRELPRGKRRHIHIPPGGDDGILPDVGRSIAGELAVGEIELCLVLE